MNRTQLWLLGKAGLSVFAAALLNLSCNKEEPIPAYIHLDAVGLNTVYNIEGSNSHKIVDAWVYVDDRLAGTFEMPCTFPVLYAGDHKVKIAAGIKENGIKDTRIAYPFFEWYEKAVTFTQGQVVTLTPSVSYVAGTTFSWIEDFDGVSHGICKGDGATNDTIMTLSTASSEVFEGVGSGKVSITSGNYLGMTCNKYTLPKAGASVFLEMNYNCNTPFNVGVVGYNASGIIELQQIAITLYPTDGWNKIYVNLSSEVTGAITSTQFAIFFSMTRDVNLSESHFFLDNLKLVH